MRIFNILTKYKIYIYLVITLSFFSYLFYLKYTNEKLENQIIQLNTQIKNQEIQINTLKTEYRILEEQFNALKRKNELNNKLCKDLIKNKNEVIINLQKQIKNCSKTKQIIKKYVKDKQKCKCNCVLIDDNYLNKQLDYLFKSFYDIKKDLDLIEIK